MTTFEQECFDTIGGIDNWVDDVKRNENQVQKDNGDLILYDWFAMSARNGSINNLIDLLELRGDINFTETYGFYGYKNRVMFDGISIHYNHWNKETNFPLLEMSGQGCRDFETFGSGDWSKLFECARSREDYNISRLDVAYDDHSGVLNMDKLLYDARKRNYLSKCRNGVETRSWKAERDQYSLMFGVKSSDYYLRVYDKASERGLDSSNHWIRAEQVFKQDRAYQFLCENSDLGQTYAGVLQNYLRFIAPSKDTNKARWATRKYWLDFLGSAEKIKLYTKKDIEYNLSRVGRYVFHQSGNSIDTYIQCMGLVNFCDMLRKRESHLNEKQKRIIREYQSGNKNALPPIFPVDFLNSERN